MPHTLSEQEAFMRQALQEAQLAVQEGNLPIGAVIVLNGEVVACGHNHRYTDHFLRHAETEAIGQLGRTFNRREEQAAIFTTVEPCWMCYGAILAANISHVYFAARDAHFGASQIHHIGQYDQTRILTYQGSILEQESFDLLYQHSEQHTRLLFGERFDILLKDWQTKWADPSSHLQSFPSPRLLAACGLYCGACYHYRASFPESQHLLREEFRGHRPLEGYTCRGCRSDRLYIHPGCVECPIRACADEKGLVHCGECADLPCARLLTFQNDGRVHHLSILEQLDDIKRKGVKQWLTEQQARWTCACGQPFSWYETVCPHCGASLDSYQTSGGELHRT